MPDDRLTRSLRNLILALQSLEEFLAEPVRTNRDKAGIIQAFEFTYELAWKTFQRLAQVEGLQVVTPRQAFASAVQMGLIPPEEEAVWLGMMQDSNLTSHTYHEKLATDIVERVRTSYFPTLRVTVARLKSQRPEIADEPPATE
jgi:nucleotidyltransferase substrate binding protein (TIGR01987 family)